MFISFDVNNWSVARIFPWGGGATVSDFLKKCSLPVDRLRCKSECYIEVEQKGGPGLPAPPPSCYTPEQCRKLLTFDVNLYNYMYSQNIVCNS